MYIGFKYGSESFSYNTATWLGLGQGLFSLDGGIAYVAKITLWWKMMSVPNINLAKVPFPGERAECTFKRKRQQIHSRNITFFQNWR